MAIQHSLGILQKIVVYLKREFQKKSSEKIYNKLTIVAISLTTVETLAEMGLKVYVMPEMYLFEEALSALGRYWDTNSRGDKET